MVQDLFPSAYLMDDICKPFSAPVWSLYRFHTFPVIPENTQNNLDKTGSGFQEAEKK
jgi:hypothetical protein